MHLITLKDWSAEDIVELTASGLKLKADPALAATTMTGKSLALLFQKTSTRTRCAGEVGMAQLGGHAFYMDWRATNFQLADLGDEIRVLSSYANFMVLRFLKHEDVVRASQTSLGPVMNGCCDRYHPLQGLTDIMTVQEALGRLEGVRLTYVGAFNNVSNSLVAAGLKVGMHVTIAAPEPNPAVIDEELFEQARRAGLLDIADDLQTALKRSDVVYTDTWLDMEFFDDPAYAEEKERRLRLYQPYQLNADLLDGLDLRIMHCLPAHHDYEIDGALLHDPRSIVFEQAENRMHSQKAVLLKLDQAD
ncbi:MAG: ornithine carbamoyltransferase [Candidatus Latescibacteria bacterium]|nr:ornithine carbamoyltransferase [Candidatus Latescibacterota bacterium]